MLPVLSRTLRTSEAASSTTASGKRMRAALRRRARVAQKYAHTQEHGAVFKVSSSLTERRVLAFAHPRGSLYLHMNPYKGGVSNNEIRITVIDCSACRDEEACGISCKAQCRATQATHQSSLTCQCMRALRA